MNEGARLMVGTGCLYCDRSGSSTECGELQLHDLDGAVSACGGESCGRVVELTSD